MADGSIASEKRPLLEMFKLLESGRDPKRADRSAAGYLPGRAMRFCDAMTTATGYGYWLFPPIDLQLMWDGEQVFWSYENAAAWLPLSGAASGAAQFPGFAEQFDRLAPPELAGLSPPFLTALPELGGVQIWTGLVTRTRPGWSLNVRLPVNLPPTSGFTAWEGIVETDHWFGPLFCNFRITRTDFPVRLRASTPFLQVQPVPQIAYHDDTLSDMQVGSPDDMGPAEWEAFGHVLVPDQAKIEREGTYAVRARKRRTCPRHQMTMQTTLED